MRSVVPNENCSITSLLGFYGSSNPTVTGTSQPQTVLPSTSASEDVANPVSVHDDQDEIVGRMDEDNLPNVTTDNETATVKEFNDESILDDDNMNQNSESSVAMEESTKNDSSIDVLPTSSENNVVAATASKPMAISRNIDIPAKNESNISLSVMETSSIGKKTETLIASSHYMHG